MPFPRQDDGCPLRESEKRPSSLSSTYLAHPISEVDTNAHGTSSNPIEQGHPYDRLGSEPSGLAIGYPVRALCDGNFAPNARFTKYSVITVYGCKRMLRGGCRRQQRKCVTSWRTKHQSCQSSLNFHWEIRCRPKLLGTHVPYVPTDLTQPKLYSGTLGWPDPR